MNNSSSDYQSLYQRAVAMLAKREHSRVELKQKLSRNTSDVAMIEQVLTALQADNYQSDERFAESLVRSRVARGKGPLFVVQELRQHGLTDALIEQSLAQAEVDWFAMAAEVRARRFGPGDTHADFKAKAKQMRFLAQRGFSQDHIEHAIAHPESD
ncbi:MAG: regulatory protein RecX [Oleiphilaceae bacterium]|nr:regulatory protein RecX [Oleiphilaceae bacterium]